MAILVFHGELGRRLKINVHEYERDVPQDPYDANWLRCSVELQLGRFSGSIDASFTTQDFARFLSELDQVVQGTATKASFHTMEEALSIRVEAVRGGRIAVEGNLHEIGAGGSVLSYCIDSDFSFLKQSHAELKRIVSEFPERTATNS